MSAVNGGRDLILGVDPGLTGALAWYDFQLQKLFAVVDMPTKVVSPTDSKNKVDAETLAAVVDSFAARTLFAVVEEVASRPDQGVASTFKFGFSAGLISGVLAANYIPIRMTKPAVWKMSMGLSSDKKLSLKKAIGLFPEKEELFKRAKDDGRAEAALLSYFGRSFLRFQNL